MLSYIFEDKFIDCYIIIDGSFVLSTDKIKLLNIIDLGNSGLII